LTQPCARRKRGLLHRNSRRLQLRLPGRYGHTGFGLSVGAAAYLDLGAYFSLGVRAGYERLICLYQGLKIDADLALHIRGNYPAGSESFCFIKSTDGGATWY
jgi:hypothetical protein